MKQAACHNEVIVSPAPSASNWSSLTGLHEFPQLRTREVKRSGIQERTEDVEELGCRYFSSTSSLCLFVVVFLADQMFVLDGGRQVCPVIKWALMLQHWCEGSSAFHWTLLLRLSDSRSARCFGFSGMRCFCWAVSWVELVLVKSFIVLLLFPLMIHDFPVGIGWLCNFILLMDARNCGQYIAQRTHDRTLVVHYDYSGYEMGETRYNDSSLYTFSYLSRYFLPSLWWVVRINI